MTASLLTATNRLARICATIKAGEIPDTADRESFAASLELYFANAQHGLTLEGAFGLSPAPGGQTWWATARRRRRDTMLRGLHVYHFSNLSAPEAARAIHATWRRYSRRQKDIDLRRGESAAAARSLEADLYVLATVGGPPGEDRVAGILDSAEQGEAAEVFETV